MNGKLAKEERRNLVKAMGETATDALERARAEVLQLRMEHAAIAKTLAEFKSLTVQETKTLHQRIDGASAWCEKNETLGRNTRLMVEVHITQATTFRERMDTIVHGGFFTRLRWVVFGILPPVPDSAFQRANQVQS